VKDNEIIWSGHLGSKGHRTNVGRQKELAKKEEERMRLEKGKRKATPDQNDSGNNDADDDTDMNESGQVRYHPLRILEGLYFPQCISTYNETDSIYIG
jgi:hypothetical protein